MLKILLKAYNNYNLFETLLFERIYVFKIFITGCDIESFIKYIFLNFEVLLLVYNDRKLFNYLLNFFY